jgi:hypothetical protein
MAERQHAMRAFMRRARARDAVEAVAGWARYEFDSLFDPVYLPDDHLPRSLRASERSDGTYSRWEQLQLALKRAEVREAVDLGCNTGWFSIEMGRQGIATLGIEEHPAYHRNALYAVRRSRLDNVAIAKMDLTTNTVRLVPEVDCVLFLALWHHLVNDQGLADATCILRHCWRKTRKLLIFETVDADAAAEFGIPAMVPDTGSWLRRYLSATCEGAQISVLGTNAVARPKKTREPERIMFALTRGRLS